MTQTATRISIDLTAGHSDSGCLEMAWQLHRQLSNGYTRDASTMPLGDFGEYLETHRTARKRAARAARLGYRFEEMERERYEDDVFAINVSTPERQGRPMSDGYLERPVFSPNPCLCPLHHVYTYGVLRNDTLVAYLWMYRSGELAMISSILGHADHLEDDVMYLLATEAIREQSAFGGTLFYNLHDSGTDGLRYFKERLGLAACDVRWER